MSLEGFWGVARRPRVRREWWVFIFALVLVDAGDLILALVFTNWLSPSNLDLPPGRMSSATLALVALFLLLCWTQGAYSRKYLLGGPMEYSRLARGCTYGVMALIAVGYFVAGQLAIPGHSLLLFWVLSMVLVAVGRFIMRRVAYYLRRRGYFITRVLLVGVDANSMAIAQQLQFPRGHGTEVLGFLDDFLPEGSVVTESIGRNGTTRLRILGPSRRVQEVLANLNADLLIVNSQALSWESVQSLLLHNAVQKKSFEMRLVALPYDLLGVGVEAAPLAYVPLLRLRNRRITGIDALMKATLDIAVAGVLLPLGLPLVAMVVFKARLQGVRPVFERLVFGGGDGQPIPVMVFRREVTDHLLLRGWPALWTVLSRRLSLVGPMPRPWTGDGDRQPRSGIVRAVRPGLTGPWRFLWGSSFGPELRLAQDSDYVRNYTIWLDVFLLWQTARVLLPLGRKAKRWAEDGSAVGASKSGASWEEVGVTGSR